jgi:hypothetical protein
VGVGECPALNNDKARVAVARRLAIIVHAMLRFGTMFQAA